MSHLQNTLFFISSHFAAVVGRGILLSHLHLFVIFASSSGSLYLQNIFSFVRHLSLFGLV